MQYEAYVDGSYKSVGDAEFYASAAIVAPLGSNDWTSIVKVANDPDLIKHRNVAGEVMAVLAVCEHCLGTLKLTTDDCLVINYDYAGIYNWTKKRGEVDFWNAKTPLSMAYRDYISTVIRPRFKVEFKHTRGHSGIRGNEIVDELAKEAINKRLAQELSK